MATPYLVILYISDDILAPCLELVRRICDPESHSKPHVTMRGPVRRRIDTPPKWESGQIARLTLVEAGQFISSNKAKVTQNTIFIRCDLHEQADMHYTPDYPTSFPHITLYDGLSRTFANKLLALLEKYSWHLDVHLSSKTNLKKIDLVKRKKKSRSTVKYSPRAKALFAELSGMELKKELIENMSDEERLKVTSLICEYLHNKLAKDQKELVELGDGPSLTSISKHDISNHIKRAYKHRHSETQLLLNLHADTLSENSRSERHRMGQFLTPPELAVEIAECALEFFPLDYHEVHFGDPAIGTGTFFSALRRALLPSSKVASCVGIEINEALSEKTKRLWERYGLEVINHDFLDLDLPSDRNLVLSNPPYVRHQFMTQERKTELRRSISDALGINVSARSDLYVYFILFCHSWMKDGAIAAWLISAEFMVTDYGSVVRKYLTEEVTLLVIHRFDPKEAQFDGVLATSCVIIYRKSPPPTGHKCRMSFGGSLLQPYESGEVSIEKLGGLNRWPASLRQLRSKRNIPVGIGDIFQIKRGIATGANAFFILPREEALSKGIPGQFLRPILPSPRFLTNDIVEDDGDGYPKLNTQLSLLDCPLPEAEVEKKFPQLWEYLQSAETLGVRDRYLVRKRRLWYMQEQRKSPHFLCTYMGRTSSGKRGPFRFIWNQSSAVATNLFILLYPLGPLQKIISKHPEKEREVFSILNEITSRDMCDGGRVYAGGLYKIEPSELARLDGSMFKDWINLNQL